LLVEGDCLNLDLAISARGWMDADDSIHGEIP
jgi:hypothetical protein